MTVGHVIKEWPFAKLIGIVVGIFSAGVATGTWVKAQMDSMELISLRAIADARTREAETLQKAIVAGNCVKSRDVDRAASVRHFLGVLSLREKYLDAWM